MQSNLFCMSAALYLKLVRDKQSAGSIPGARRLPPSIKPAFDNEEEQAIRAVIQTQLKSTISVDNVVPVDIVYEYFLKTYDYLVLLMYRLQLDPVANLIDGERQKIPLEMVVDLAREFTRDFLVYRARLGMVLNDQMTGTTASELFAVGPANDLAPLIAARPRLNVATLVPTVRNALKAALTEVPYGDPWLAQIRNLDRSDQSPVAAQDLDLEEAFIVEINAGATKVVDLLNDYSVGEKNVLRAFLERLTLRCVRKTLAAFQAKKTITFPDIALTELANTVWAEANKYFAILAKNPQYVSLSIEQEVNIVDAIFLKLSVEEASAYFKKLTDLGMGLSVVPEDINNNFVGVVKSVGYGSKPQSRAKPAEVSTKLKRTKKIDDEPALARPSDDKKDFEPSVEDLNRERVCDSVSVSHDDMPPFYSRALKKPLLSDDQIIELHQKAMEGDVRAFDRLVEANLRFVVSIAWFYYRRYHKVVQLDDLVQEGNIGLMMGIRRFDHLKGYKLITYASYWIRSMIRLFVFEKTRDIHIPGRMQARHWRSLRVKAELTRKLQREPNIDEVRVAMGLKPLAKRLSTATDPATLSQVMTFPISLSPTTNDDKPLEIVDVGSATPDNLIANKEEKQIVLDSLCEVLVGQSGLSARLQKILSLRFGIVSADNPEGNEFTLQEVGEILNITRERVRQLETKALKQVKAQLIIKHPQYEAIVTELLNGE